MINITTKLSAEDYVKVNYHMFYRKWVMKAMTGFGLFFIFLAIITYISSGVFSWFLIIFGLFITVGLRIQLYFNAKRVFKSDGRIGENINYQFDNEEVKITGESFNSRLTWDKVYNVTESKDFVLIWQNLQIANVVPKNSFNGEDLKAFKELVKAKKGLKSKLK